MLHNPQIRAYKPENIPAQNNSNQQNNASTSSTRKTKQVLSQFKETLKQTEHNIQTHSLTPNKSNLETDYHNSFRLNQTLNETDDYTPLLEDEVLSRWKISNDVLIKANLELKSKNQLWETELSQYKNSSIYKSPYTQYDANLNDFIDSLKSSLDQAQIANKEQREIISHLQSQSEKWSASNSNLISTLDKIKSEYELKTKENSEMKVYFHNQNNSIKAINEEKKELEYQVQTLRNEVLNKEKEIEYITTVNASASQTVNDNADWIEKWKVTITNLQSNNEALTGKIGDLNQEKLISEEVSNEKDERIHRLSREIKEKELDMDILNKRIKDYDNKISDWNNKLSNASTEKQDVLLENEKWKTKIDKLSLFLEDRERTIATLKESVSFWTKTFDKDISAIKLNNTTNNGYTSDRARTTATDNVISSELFKEQQSRIDNWKEDNYELLQQNEEYQKAINDYVIEFEKSKNEYQLLYQKYREQMKLIDHLKEEYCKQRKDTELNELIKANESIMGKLQRIQEENKLKTSEWNTWRINYERVNNQLMQSQRWNTNLTTDNNNNNHWNVGTNSGTESSTNVNNYNNSNNGNNNDNNNNNTPKFMTIYNTVPSINQKRRFLCEINDWEESLSSKPSAINTSERRFNTVSNASPINVKDMKTEIYSINIYTTKLEDLIIAFNTESKLFRFVSYIDRTNELLQSQISTLSNKFDWISFVQLPNGIIIVINNGMFFYSEETNELTPVRTLTTSYWKPNCIVINNELYIVSGKSTKCCEKIFLADMQGIELPKTSFIHFNGSMCWVNHSLLYLFFGKNNSIIERWNINTVCMKDTNNTSWEVINYSFDHQENSVSLEYFISYEFKGNLLLLGGKYDDDTWNKEVFSLDSDNKSLAIVGHCEDCGLFNTEMFRIDGNEIFGCFDVRGNLHVFNKEINFYNVFNIDG